MADEITTTLKVNLVNDILRFDFNSTKLMLDQTTQGIFDSVRSIATSETSVALTGITTPGIAIIWNLDATNFCEFGTTTADYPIKLRPKGIPNIIDLNASKTTLYLKADTAATLVRIVVLAQ